MVERCDATHNSCLELFTQCRGETVWKIAGRPLEGALLAPGGANRLLFAPSWRPYSPRFGTHSEFPNSFGIRILRSSALPWYSDVFCAMAHIHSPQTVVGCSR